MTEPEAHESTPRDKRWTLSEIAQELGANEHRILAMYELDVMTPDAGNGGTRRAGATFSARNMLEFRIGLHLRRLPLPMQVIQAINRTLRWTENKIHETRQKNGRSFTLPWDLLGQHGTKVRVLITDGQQVEVRIADPAKKPVILRRRYVKGQLQAQTTQETRRRRKNTDWKVEIDVKRMADQLPLTR